MVNACPMTFGVHLSDLYMRHDCDVSVASLSDWVEDIVRVFGGHTAAGMLRFVLAS